LHKAKKQTHFGDGIPVDTGTRPNPPERFYKTKQGPTARQDWHDRKKQTHFGDGCIEVRHVRTDAVSAYPPD